MASEPGPPPAASTHNEEGLAGAALCLQWHHPCPRLFTWVRTFDLLSASQKERFFCHTHPCLHNMFKPLAMLFKTYWLVRAERPAERRECQARHKREFFFFLNSSPGSRLSSRPSPHFRSVPPPPLPSLHFLATGRSYSKCDSEYNSVLWESQPNSQTQNDKLTLIMIF